MKLRCRWLIDMPESMLTDPSGPDGKGRNRLRAESNVSGDGHCRLRPTDSKTLWENIARDGNYCYSLPCDGKQDSPQTCPRYCATAETDPLRPPGFWREDQDGRCWSMRDAHLGWGAYGSQTSWEYAATRAAASWALGHTIYWRRDDAGPLVSVGGRVNVEEQE